MYTAYFGLQQEPFSIAPDPRFLFMSERHREALAHLLYGVKGGGGFVLLSGEIGAGKTTVCRCFLEQVPKRCNVAYVFNPKLDVDELLQTVCQEFHVPTAHEGPGKPSVKARVDALNDFLLRTHAVGQNNVLIIDEAQNLSAEVLEQLRLLTNLETNERKLLQIILIGQPELRALLARPELEQLAQRVIARYHLEALSASETEAYIRHRMSVAGLAGPLPFERSALKRIHALTGGVPRRINLLCDRALLGAYATGRQRVDAGIVERAALEVFGTAPRRGRPVPLGRGLVAGALSGAAVFGMVALAVVFDARLPSPGTSGGLASVAVPHAPSTASSALPVPAPAAAASVAAGTTAVALRSEAFTELDPARAWRTEREALRALAARWGVPSGPGSPCTPQSDAEVQCHRASGSLALLRQLDRPAVLTLSAGAEARYAVVVALDERQATLLLPDGAVNVAPGALAGRWQGEFATLYRLPPGHPGAGPQAASAWDAWLPERLDQVGAGAAGRPVAERVAAFQIAHGLKPDGKVGPVTTMQLNRALGVDEPRLNAPR